MTALQHLETTTKKNYSDYWQLAGTCVKAWQGHILDLLKRRDEALTCYKKSLEINDGTKVACFVDSIFIDKDWLEERLKTPFTWGMENKSIILPTQTPRACDDN